MRIFLFVVLGVLALVGGGVAFLPMSVAADLAARQSPDFKYTEATGSVWDGTLKGFSYGQQQIGDLSVKTELLALLSGKAAGTVGLVREGFTGKANVSYGLGDGGLDIKDLTIDGLTAMVPGMPETLARTDGRFTLKIADLKFAKSLCEAATGEVWTDVLTRVNMRGWVGPELRGPVTCQGGQVQVEAGGETVSGEEVLAMLSITPNLDMTLTGTVSNAGPGAVQALSPLGFVAEGDKLVLRQGLGSN